MSLLLDYTEISMNYTTKKCMFTIIIKRLFKDVDLSFFWKWRKLSDRWANKILYVIDIHSLLFVNIYQQMIFNYLDTMYFSFDIIRYFKILRFVNSRPISRIFSMGDQEEQNDKSTGECFPQIINAAHHYQLIAQEAVGSEHKFRSASSQLIEMNSWRIQIFKKAT